MFGISSPPHLGTVIWELIYKSLLNPELFVNNYNTEDGHLWSVSQHRYAGNPSEAVIRMIQMDETVAIHTKSKRHGASFAIGPGHRMVNHIFPPSNKSKDFH
jgi:hypothetical protein